MKNGKLRPSSRAVNRAELRAFDAMIAARPRKPPPLPRFVGNLRSAGELELEREKRRGFYSTRGAYFHLNGKPSL